MLPYWAEAGVRALHIVKSYTVVVVVGVRGGYY